MATAAAPISNSVADRSAVDQNVDHPAADQPSDHLHAEHKRKRQHKIALPETAANFAEPLLPYAMGTTIQEYFTLLKDVVDTTAFDKVEKAEVHSDGLYLHKRPLAGVDSTNKGTVTHHVVLYLKDGEKMHSLDFGPDNGADVTSNFMMDHPSREVLKVDTSIPDEDVLPLMYIGKTDLTLSDESVAQAVRFAEAQMYHAIRNNCIHFADMMVRVLTRGKVRGAPLLYDIVCGKVPAQDPPESLMLAMLGLSWFSVCDGSPLTARFLTFANQPVLQHSISISDLPSKRQEPDASHSSDSSSIPPDSTKPVLPNPSSTVALLSVLSTLHNAQQPNSIPVQNNAGPNLMTLLNLNVAPAAAGAGVGAGAGVNRHAQHTLVESASTDSLQSSDTRDEA